MYQLYGNPKSIISYVTKSEGSSFHGLSIYTSYNCWRLSTNIWLAYDGYRLGNNLSRISKLEEIMSDYLK